MKILTVLGARPQFIKASMVSRAIIAHPALTECIVHTGQHFDDNMSDLFFREMEIPEPKYNLGIGGQNQASMISGMLTGLVKVLDIEKPDLVLVYGDTNSTLAGALAAKSYGCKLAHVEAGMRSYKLEMKEEINRVLTDRISDFLFCSTARAMENLKVEGYNLLPCSLYQCGDVMLDAALHYSTQAENNSDIIKKSGLIDFVLCTLHRAENTDDVKRLEVILSALNEIHSELEVLLPLHPRTRKMINQHQLKANIRIIDPVGYFDMIQLLKHCTLVMTDSGGLQKEAFFFSKHCVTLRDETEWTELTDGGFNVLAGADPQQIREGFDLMLRKKSDFLVPLFGNGDAAQKIVKELASAVEVTTQNNFLNR